MYLKLPKELDSHRWYPVTLKRSLYDMINYVHVLCVYMCYEIFLIEIENCDQC